MRDRSRDPAKTRAKRDRLRSINIEVVTELKPYRNFTIDRGDYSCQWPPAIWLICFRFWANCASAGDPGASLSSCLQYAREVFSALI